MKRFVFVLLLAPLTAAAEPGNQFFIGAEVADYTEEGTATVQSSNLSTTGKDSATSLNLKVGGLFDRLRLYGTVHLPAQEDDDSSVWVATISADYLFLPREQQVNLFAGINGGLYYSEIRDFFADGTDFQMTSTTVGAEAGVLVNFLPIQLEAGGRYMVGTGSDNNWDGVKTELDSVAEVYAGANLVF